MKALCIIKKYPPPMVIQDSIKEKIRQKMKEITQPKKMKQTDPKDIIFCPIWIRKFF